MVLLAQRRWRKLAWTAMWSAAPFHAFFTYHLTRMASGAVFPFLENFASAAAINHFVHSIAIKVHHLGVTWGEP